VSKFLCRSHEGQQETGNMMQRTKLKLEHLVFIDEEMERNDKLTATGEKMS
jgi:hypothetical protein